MNKVVISGRWTKDIEYKALESGKSLSKSSLAVDEGFGDKKQTFFFDVEMWGKTAENVANHSGKGRKVLIEGRLKVDTWEKDGQKRSAVRIVAEQVEFLDYKDRDGGGNDLPSDNDAPPVDISDDSLPF
jgi:single-strand DNA-binding protein